MKTGTACKRVKLKQIANERKMDTPFKKPQRVYLSMNKFSHYLHYTTVKFLIVDKISRNLLNVTPLCPLPFLYLLKNLC